jgi:diguanylate cyclase (GGDEF)-like protein
MALIQGSAVHRTSLPTSLIRMPRLEILGSLAVLAASLLFGLVLIYLIALVHRSEERDAMADFGAMFDEGGNPSNMKVSHPFLEGASDVIIAGDHLAPGEACVQFLSDKIHELHPEFDLAPAHVTMRHFCDSRGAHGEIEPLGQLNAVLALRPVHLEGALGIEIMTVPVTALPSPLILRQYPRLLALVFSVSLLCAGLAFHWLHGYRRRLRELTRDGLTGALRRESFTETLDLAIKQARTTVTPLCIAVLDLDNLKPINDRHGHGAGDKTLQDLVNIARAHLRSADVIGRLGGDEFAVLMAGATQTAAGTIAENIRNEFARSSAVAATVSIGVAELDPDDTPDQFIRRADQRLYAAKRTRNAVAMP